MLEFPKPSNYVIHLFYIKFYKFVLNIIGINIEYEFSIGVFCLVKYIFLSSITIIVKLVNKKIKL